MLQYSLILLLSLLAGMVLGLLFFGGLWWTVKRLTVVSNPGLLMGVSLLLRTVLTMVGLYWVFDGQLDRLLAALLGMLMVRLWLRRRIAAQIDGQHTGGIDEGVGT